MNFEKAASIQYLRKTQYTVEIVSPEGVVTRLGSTSRKSKDGILHLIRNNLHVQAKFLEVCGDGNYKKTKEGIKLDNGFLIRFGNTIRQDAEK